MSDTAIVTKKEVVVQVAQIIFRQPDREYPEETSGEFQQLVNRKSQEIMNYLIQKNLYNASGLQLEKERQLTEVCKHPDCRNIFKYADYKEAIKWCKMEHSIDVQLEMATVGLIWCLVLPKEYEKTIGFLNPKNYQNSITLYELEAVPVNFDNNASKTVRANDGKGEKNEQSK